MKSQIVTFLIKCPDQKGLVAKITNFFYQEGFNIISCQQYVNSIEDTYFMRVRLNAEGINLTKDQLENSFLDLARPLNFDWSVNYGDKKQNVAIMVSHTSHNLYDLLERAHEGLLNCNVKMVISNHNKLRHIADMFNVPFYHLPITKETKKVQEAQVKELLDTNKVDGIFTVDEISGALVTQVLNKRFIRIPEDIAIVGFTNGILSRYSTPPLTSVNRFAHTTGEVAANRLIDKIEEIIKFDDVKIDIIRTELVERESTKKTFVKF